MRGRSGVRFIKGLLLVLLAGTISSALIAQEHLEDGRLLRLSTGEWAPYIEQHQLGYGPVSQIVVESFRNVGVSPVVRFWPWSRARASLAAGQVEASYAWSKTEEREAQFHYSEPFFETRNVFFYRKGFPFDWSKVSDLSKFRIGGVQDYAYNDELLEAEKSGALNIIRVVSERQLVLLLMAGRIDAFPAEEMVGRELFKEYASGRINDFSVHPQALQKRALYVIARKTPAGKALLEQFNHGLEALKKSGRYQDILGRSSMEALTSSALR